MTTVAEKARAGYGSEPEGWTRRRLRFDVRLNPKKSSLDMEPDELVSFIPMDAVGEYGGLKLGEVRELEEVYNGYTYFEDGDLCIAKITPCFENGKGALAEGLTNGVGFGTTELHVVRPGPTIDRRFLFYISIAHDFRNIGESEMYGAGGQKRIDEGFIKDWMPPLPPLDTQQRIARFLDEKTARIDGLIEKKRALLDRLAEKRQALITRAVTKGLNPDAPMKPSGIDWLGDIPAHWEVLPLKRRIVGIEQGWSPSADERVAADDEWGVLKSGCVNEGVYDQTSHKALPSLLEPRLEIEVHPGDILMCRASGSLKYIGSVALVRETRPLLMFSDKTYRLTLEEKSTDKSFFVYSMAAKHLREQIRLSVSGAEGLANNIAQSSVGRYLHSFPPLCEQIEIANYLDRLSGLLERTRSSIRESLRQLQDYRSALITAAVTGQIPELL